jgi:hypothetical protein
METIGWVRAPRVDVGDAVEQDNPDELWAQLDLHDPEVLRPSTRVREGQVFGTETQAQFEHALDRLVTLPEPAAFLEDLETDDAVVLGISSVGFFSSDDRPAIVTARLGPDGRVTFPPSCEARWWSDALDQLGDHLGVTPSEAFVALAEGDPDTTAAAEALWGTGISA